VAALPPSPGRRGADLRLYMTTPTYEETLYFQQTYAGKGEAFAGLMSHHHSYVWDGQEVSVERMKTVLRDHGNRPESICRHCEDQPDDAPAAVVLETLASVIMDLTEGTLHITEGPPCRSEYTEHTFSRSWCIVACHKATLEGGDANRESQRR